jgi:molybdopterin synthase sulfur carrier subunit
MPKVIIPTILRQFTDGQKYVEGTGETLADLLVSLETRHPGLSDRLVQGTELKKYVNVYVNDDDARLLGGLKTVLKRSDTITILPAVAGGSR